MLWNLGEQSFEVLINIQVVGFHSLLDCKNVGLLLVFVTGMRIGEIVTLKHEDIADGGIKVRCTETRYRDADYVCSEGYPKTKAGVHTIVVPKDYEWVCEYTKNLNPNGEFIFSEGGDENRYTTKSMRMRLKRLCKKLGIFHKSPHKIRKTYGTILMDANVDDNLLLQQMGHVDRTVSERHYHCNRKTIDKKRAILDNIPDLQA